MPYHYNSYREAEKAAIAHSLANPGVAVYVDWVEDNEWTISNFEEYPEQDYYMNGQRMLGYDPEDEGD